MPHLLSCGSSRMVAKSFQLTSIKQSTWVWSTTVCNGHAKRVTLLCSCAADKPATGYNLVPAVTLYALTTDKPLRVAFNFCGPFEVSTTVSSTCSYSTEGLLLA